MVSLNEALLDCSGWIAYSPGAPWQSFPELWVERLYDGYYEEC